MGMGMNHWEWKGMELKKTFPLISTVVTLVGYDQSQKRVVLLVFVTFAACRMLD